jgi:general secretion pathway protein N
VIGETEAIAIFLDQTNQGVLRLRTGEGHEGWVLSAVVGREATLQRGSQTETFALPTPADTAPGSPAPRNIAGAPAIPGVATPSSSGMIFAPFIPRSTPKNGEPDGL